MISFKRLPARIAPLFLAVFVGFSVACSPQGGGSGSSPGADADPAKNQVLQGTVSGGGGNGCNGRTFEQYAKRISTLREYQYVLKPLLRRMEEQGGDPFVTYLLWAAEEKVWYFVPCELQKLSTEQIGVAIQSDQLALHGEHGIYIHSVEGEKAGNSYFSKRMKAQAGLLLHEMVMGARLLMKQTAKKQCAALAKKDAKLCSDPELMAIAEAQTVDPKQALIMDAADHEAVRAMTVLLSQPGVDLSADNLRSVRERLGFNFPWSRAMSSLTPETFFDAFTRSRQLGDRFVVAGSKHYAGERATCSISLEVGSRKNWAQFTIRPVSYYSYNESATYEDRQALQKKIGTENFNAVCANRAGYITKGYDYYGGECREGKLVAWSDEGAFVNFNADKFEARGILRDGKIYDEVVISSSAGRIDGRAFETSLTRFLITRDQAPRVFSIRVEPKQFLERSASEAAALGAENRELLDVPNIAPLECVRN